MGAQGKFAPKMWQRTLVKTFLHRVNAFNKPLCLDTWKYNLIFPLFMGIKNFFFGGGGVERFKFLQCRLKSSAVCGRETSISMMTPSSFPCAVLLNANRAGATGKRNTPWGPRQVRGDRSNFQTVRVPIGPAQSAFSDIAWGNNIGDDGDQRWIVSLCAADSIITTCKHNWLCTVLEKMQYLVAALKTDFPVCIFLLNTALICEERHTPSLPVENQEYTVPHWCVQHHCRPRK